MTDSATLEERVAKLERRMERLEDRQDSVSSDQCWVDDISGSMSKIPQADYDDFLGQCQKSKQD